MDCHPGTKGKLMYAAIDIGTNTALLLIADIRRRGGTIVLETIREEQRVPRLGKGVDLQKRLSEESIERVVQVLNEYRAIIEEEYPSVNRIAVTATSAVRDSDNREEFTGRIKNNTGFETRVLSGHEEAEYTFQGALSVLDREEQPAVVLDIGGGSTELARGTKSTGLLDRCSLDMGCVRFTERYLTINPPAPEQVEQCREAAGQLLRDSDFPVVGGAELIGVAGTVTSLAFMELELKIYNFSGINDVRLRAGTVEKWTTDILQMSSALLVDRYPEVMQGRADIFPAGMLILEEVMQYYGFEELTVSAGGIRHGVVLELSGQ